MASRTLTASQGNAAKPGGRARRPCLRQTPLVELYSGEPALTRDAGCRIASHVWTCAQLHYLTKRQQRNVDNETTYKTSAMKQPKRSGLAWSHGRDAALLRAVSSRSSTTGTWWSLASALPCLQGLQYRTQCAGTWQLWRQLRREQPDIEPIEICSRPCMCSLSGTCNSTSR